MAKEGWRPTVLLVSGLSTSFLATQKPVLPHLIIVFGQMVFEKIPNYRKCLDQCCC